MKTVPTENSVMNFLSDVTPEERRNDCLHLLDMMQRITGKPPVMWGPSIVGFDQYHYKYDSGREGDYFRVGFSPRKTALTIYIMPGYHDFGGLLEKLGKHKTGKSCLYIKQLSDIDLEILEAMIRKGLEWMAENYPH